MIGEYELRRQLELLHPACWGWALACCGRDREEAADTLQSAYLRILEGRARFGGRSALRTWVFGVIRMVARERRVQSARRSRHEAAAAPEPPWATEPPGEWEDAPEGERELLVALGALSSRQREVLDLVFYHRHTIEQAVEIMRVTVGTARTHYERGKRRLRQLLANPQGVR